MGKIIYFVLASVLLWSCSKKTTEIILKEHNTQSVLTIDTDKEKKETKYQYFSKFVSTEHENPSAALKFLSINYKYNKLTYYAYHDYGQKKEDIYFYGFDGYSEAIIWYYDTVTLMLKHYGSQDGFSTFGSGYPLGLEYHKYEGQNGSIGYRAFLGASSNYGFEYLMEDGKLLSWSVAAEAAKNDYKFGPVITYTGDIINELDDCVIFSNGITVHASYEAIPRDELFNIFITLYLDGIDYISGGWGESIDYKDFNNDIRYIFAIMGRTKKELEIFRNYIYARHGYKFESEEWNNFFIKHRPDYKGTKTYDEVIWELNGAEMYLLEIISQEEKKLR